jgi:SAM-dependent methyltransferase
LTHEAEEPSAWVARWASFAPAGEVLDLACGGGRHARYFAGLGYRVCAVDRDPRALPGLQTVGGITTCLADLEDGSAWPFEEGRFTGIVVTNYLHRPLFPHIAKSLAEGGVLLYETFMLGNERYGKPSNPRFLLRPGELFDEFSARLNVLAFEQGGVQKPKRAMIQRLCAKRGSFGEALLQP